MKEFSSFDVAVVVLELTETILDSRVNNIYQLDNKTLLLRLHKTDKPPFTLIMEAGRRLHLTSFEAEKPQTPPAFCMALRKYLRNALLTGIKQHEFERVVLFSFKTKDGAVQLVLELFGDGNIILTSEEGKILQALVYKRMRDRNILRNEIFQFAPSGGKNPFKTSEKELLEGLKNAGNIEVVRATARFLGIGGVYAEELLSKTGIEKTRQCSTLSEDDISRLFSCLQYLLSQITDAALDPHIILDSSGSYVDVVSFKLRRYESEGFSFQRYASFNEALDEFYTSVTTIEKALASVNIDKIKHEAERLKRIILDQEKTLVEEEAKANLEKQIGGTIYTHMSDLQALVDKFLAGKQKGKDWNEIVAEIASEKKSNICPACYFESFDCKSLIINLRIGNLKFTLNMRKNMFENAADFYEKGKKAKQKLIGARGALEETRKKLAEVETKITETKTLEQAKPSEAIKELASHKVRRKEWFEKFRWFISSDGFLVVAGKDATTNEVLIKRYAEIDDVVFHADIAGAPFVIVKIREKQPSEQVLREAGEFAAAFSRGWREGFGSIDVYWVKPEQLSKSGPSGEYVAHGAFVVSGKRNWLRNVALKVAVGVAVTATGEIKFVGGPVDSVKSHASSYMVIGPGNMEGKELLKAVLKALARNLPTSQQERVLKTSAEEIRGYIPYGVGKILEARF
jgi:predicted ribosome quality control (RQC) complex YloA/Tae2 family protein